ncbi:MAG TPA: MBL fold metallo-hydrolase [Firmicutes bacterium]|nr:MBL fold metallo-hydrolase [Candidatus Fermentithermobacillaceae bacterium]
MSTSEPVFRRVEEGVFTYLRPLGKHGPAVVSVLFMGLESVLAFDTLCNPRDMTLFSKMARDRQVYVAYSHADWDHCLGTGAFNAAVVIAHEFARGRLLAPSHPELEEIRRESPELVKGGEPVLPSLTFTSSLALDLERVPHWSLRATGKGRHGPGSPIQPVLTGDPSGRRIEIRHLPGHTADSCVAYDVTTGVLAAGDAVEDPFPSIGDPRSLSTWIAGLREWAARVRTVIPGHGQISGPELLKRNAKYLRTVAGIIKEAASKGMPPENLDAEYGLEKAFPEIMSRLDSMDPREREFYIETHRENLFRAWSALS